MTFQDWTWREVQAWIFEAVETDRALPAFKGPKMFGNSMPEPVRERWKDAARNATKYRKRLLPSEVSRYDQVLDWMVRILGPDRAPFVWGYAVHKVMKGLRMSDFADDYGKSTETTREWFRQDCQQIADDLNRNRSMRLNNTTLQTWQNLAHENPDTLDDVSLLSTPKGINGWMAEGAKPRHLPEQHERPKETG